jgi:hypothetical protein
MLAGGLAMKLTALGHTSGTVKRARSRQDRSASACYPRWRGVYPHRPFRVCATLRPRAVGFTKPKLSSSKLLSSRPCGLVSDRITDYSTAAGIRQTGGVWHWGKVTLGVDAYGTVFFANCR